MPYGGLHPDARAKTDTRVLYSSDYKFIFVHVPKTAGSSLHHTLEPMSTVPSRNLFNSLTRRLPIVERPERAHFRIHDTAEMIRRKISPAVYDALTSFAVVRNPFDHAVSHYEYMKQYRNPRLAKRFGAMPFADYLAYRAEPRLPWDRLFVRMPDQSHFLVDSEGHLLVTEVLKFENLNADFAQLSGRLGLPVQELPRVNATKSRQDKTPFQEYYDEQCLELVRLVYERDFEVFGYSDDLPA